MSDTQAMIGAAPRPQTASTVATGARLPSVSVVVCSHDRLHYVRACMESLARQSVGRDGFEIVLVDSGSPPSVAAEMKRIAEQTPNSRLVRLDVSGVSLARNEGARAAGGDYIAYIDDDAMAEPDWIEQIQHVLAEHGCRPAVLGGKVLPAWEAPLPGWWPPSLRGVLSIIEHEGAGEYRTASVPATLEPYGVNMILRRDAMLQVGGFAEALGRMGLVLQSDEEVQLAWRLQDAGYSAIYDSRVVVRHSIQARRFLRRMAAGPAILAGRLDRAHAPPARPGCPGASRLFAPAVGRGDHPAVHLAGRQAEHAPDGAALASRLCQRLHPRGALLRGGKAGGAAARKGSRTMLTSTSEAIAGTVVPEPAAPGAAISVLFATRNRAEALAPVLESFTKLNAPAGGWKLVVVDNGSTDGTARLLRGFAAGLPLTVLTEPRAGKNRALNAALPHLEGALVVLTDDDVLPRADWLVRLQQAALQQPERSLFGGTVLPHWSRPPPSWLTEKAVPFSVLYAQQKRHAGPCSFDAIFGPNMAVRSSVFAAGHRFSETVGPDETRRMYAMGGETEFLRRVEAAGYAGWFVPEAVVGHIIRPEQLDEDWILQRAYRYGIGEGSQYAGPPHRLRLRALAYGLGAGLTRLLPRSALRLKIRYKARTLDGTMDAWRQQRGAIRAPARTTA